MSCKPCQRCFVQVAELLAVLRDEKLPPAAEAKARALFPSLMVIGEYLTAKEIQELGPNKKSTVTR